MFTGLAPSEDSQGASVPCFSPAIDDLLEMYGVPGLVVASLKSSEGILM